MTAVFGLARDRRLATALQKHFIYVAPAPIFPGFERLHHRMLGLMKMFRGVLVLRRVAAAYVPALETQPEMHPGVVHLETFLASFAARWEVLDFFLMRTSLGHAITSEF
jgi:hypothetical protein